MRRATLVILLCACGSESASPKRCEEVVHKMMGPGPRGDSFARRPAAEQDEIRELRKQMATDVAASCQAEAWSPALLDCIGKADDTKASLNSCDSLYTPGQLTSLKQILASYDKRMPGNKRPAQMDPAEIEKELAVIEKDIAAAEAVMSGSNSPDNELEGRHGTLLRKRALAKDRLRISKE